jgi:predicted O-methyltransferase YrrM
MNDTLLALLRELENFAAANDARATARHEKMLNITPDTGQLLAILVQATKARRVLEIGTSNGYSTLWLADAAKSISGSVVTVEISPAKADRARQNLHRSGLATLVRQELSEAGHFLAQQPQASFDLIFLDADRAQYVAWWPAIERVLTPGGLLVIDNAVSHASEIAKFHALLQTAAWPSLVLPIGKGELVALKPSP